MKFHFSHNILYLKSTLNRDSLNRDFTVHVFVHIRSFMESTAKIQLNKQERAYYLDLLRKLDEICSRFNLTYFLVAGSLLGQARMGKMMPWDDDLDVAMESGDTEKFVDIVAGDTDATRLKTVRPASTVKFFSDFYYTNRPKDKPWNWPFIDIFPFERVNDGKIRLEGDTFENDIVFPLQRVTFEGIRIPAPKQIRRFLELSFNRDIFRYCQIGTYDHRREKVRYQGRASVKCEYLLQYFNIKL